MKFGLKTSALIYTLFSIVAAQTELDEYCSDETPSLPPGSQQKVSTAWFAGWHEDQYTLTDVPWSKYTHLTYAFALTTEDPTKLDESGLTGLPDFVHAARANRVKALVSIGGWTGSRWFSKAVESADNRKAFVKTIIDLVVKYKLDGVDFDWEYPNNLGIGCNSINDKDAENFLLFLEELRAHPAGKILILTAAASTSPWAGPDGKPLTDVSSFAKIFDHVTIMNYDVWGSWSPTVGPNAPLDDSCASPANQIGSAASAVKAWTNAGFPANKLVLGVPAYGHSFRVRQKDAFVQGSTTQLAPYPSFDAQDQPAGDKWDGQPGEVDVCGVKSTKPGGVITYWGMIDLGYLDHDGSPKSGRPYWFDTCSKTVYSYNPEKEILVSYDDPQSFRAKGKFIKEQNLQGFAMWEAGGDYKSYLIDAVREGMGA